MEKYKYYLIYLYGKEEHTGGEFISRDSPIDNEDALIAETERLKKIFKGPVQIIDWKRIF